jgi:hypothetical protein
MFDGFSAEDFNAYHPDKWGSNMFTLPRRKVKDKLEGMSRHLASALEAAGVGVRAHLSDDHPSLWNKKKVDTQWLFFSRDEAAERELAEVIDLERTLAATLADPTPLYRHVFLGVAVRMERLDVGLWLHHDAWVDRRNLLSLLADGEARARFDALVRDLPEETEIGLTEGEMARARELDRGKLDALLGAFEEKKGWVFVGARIPSGAAISFGQDALGKIAELFDRLVPLYMFSAWSKSNDSVSIDGVVTQRRREIEAAEAEIDRERLEREGKRREQEEARRKLREETEERARAEQVWRERERAIRRAVARSAPQAEEVQPPPQLQPQPQPQPQAPAAEKREPAPVARPAQPPREQPPRQPAKPQAASRSAQAPAPPAKISEERKADVHVGDEVVVLKGFLKGRAGVVQTIEEKGDLKVAFGSLTARVPRADVEGRGPRAAHADGGDRRQARPR